mgnify:CR=1 FL=1
MSILFSSYVPLLPRQESSFQPAETLKGSILPWRHIITPSLYHFAVFETICREGILLFWLKIAKTAGLFVQKSGCFRLFRRGLYAARGQYGPADGNAPQHQLVLTVQHQLHLRHILQ